METNFYRHQTPPCQVDAAFNFVPESQRGNSARMPGWASECRQTERSIIETFESVAALIKCQLSVGFPSHIQLFAISI